MVCHSVHVGAAARPCPNMATWAGVVHPWSVMGFDVLKEGGEPFEGLLLRKDDKLKINHLWLEHYVDPGAQRQNRVSNPNEVNRIWFDDVVVSTQYIGPIRGGKPAD
jgi:hypothetical protein